MLETPAAEGLFPHVKDAPSFKAMCRILNELGVLALPASVKRPIARELCERLGFEPSDRSFVDKLSPSVHTAERVEKDRAASRVINNRARATDEGREKARAANRASCRAARATDEGRDRHRAASRTASRAARATQDGREKANASSRATQATYYKPDGRYHTDPVFRLTRTLRRGVQRIKQATGVEKEGSTLVLLDGTRVEWRELLGCSFAEANASIESRFVEDMSWENHGTEWHIDHRTPIKAFQDDPRIEVLRIVLHVDNLWPMWGPENLEKGDDYDPAGLAGLIAAL